MPRISSVISNVLCTLGGQVVLHVRVARVKATRSIRRTPMPPQRRYGPSIVDRDHSRPHSAKAYVAHVKTLFIAQAALQALGRGQK